MPRIALVEPYDHGEVLYSLAALLLGQPEVELLVFAQHYIQRNAPALAGGEGRIRWFPFDWKERAAFFQQQKNQLNACRLIIWITAVPPVAWINRLGLKPPLVLVVHNRYSWFEPYRRLYLPWDAPLQFIASLARLFQLALFHRPAQQKMLRQVSAVAFPSRNILKSAIKAGHLPASGKVFYLPFSCYQGVEASAPGMKSPPIRIAVPGTVTGNGRDYCLLARAFEQIIPRLSRPVELLLLGRAAPGDSMVGRLKKLQGRNFRLLAFEQWIPQQEYEEYLKKTDFLALPFRPFRRFGVVRELLGESAISGSISDMVQFGLPAICSKHYHLEEGLEQMVAQYEDLPGLARLLLEWINEEKYLAVRQRAAIVLEKFRCEQLGVELWGQLIKLQNTS